MVCESSCFNDAESEHDSDCSGRAMYLLFVWTSNYCTAAAAAAAAGKGRAGVQGCRWYSTYTKYSSVVQSVVTDSTISVSESAVQHSTVE